MNATWSTVVAAVSTVAHETSVLLPPFVAIALITMLLVREIISGIELAPVRRLNRMLSVCIMPLLLIFAVSVITTLMIRILANLQQN